MRKSQRIGAHGEDLAARILDGIGIRQLERIGTPVRQIDGRVIYGAPVAADFRGVNPIYPRFYGTPYCVEALIGQSVLVEVKTVEHNLHWSDFREHQPGKLSEHTDLGGLSLVVWVHSSGVYVMRWPIEGFAPGRGITPQMAAGFDIGG